MASQNMFGLCSRFRPFLQPRSSFVLTNQNSCLYSKSVEEKLGYPAKPKKPSSVFLRFLQQVRPTLRKTIPNGGLAEQAKLGSSMWASCDPALKKKLEDEYCYDMKKYYAAMSEYDKLLTEEQKNEIKEAKEMIKELKERRIVKNQMNKKAEEFGKPKRPLSAFLMFSVSESKKRGDTSLVQFQKEIGKKWRDLPSTVKDKYKTEAEEAWKVYAIELSKWEDKMMKLGNTELLRIKTGKSQNVIDKKNQSL